MVRAKNYLKRKIGQYPSIYFLKRYIDSDINRLGVKINTEITITGFGRSGNTFATIAFQQAQSREVNIAHHVHVPAQVIKSANLNIPTIVLIRNPIDSVVSSLVKGNHLREKEISLYGSEKIKNYYNYYKKILPYRKSFFIAPFNMVIKDFGKIISRFNERFNTSYKVFDHSKKKEKKVFNLIENINKDMHGNGFTKLKQSFPSSEKEKIKENVRKKLEGFGFEATNKSMQIYREYLNNSFFN